MGGGLAMSYVVVTLRLSRTMMFHIELFPDHRREEHVERWSSVTVRALEGRKNKPASASQSGVFWSDRCC